MRVLLTNDDGITAPGLEALRRSMDEIGEVTIVAPPVELSGISHAVSLITPLRFREFYVEDRLYGYVVEGTPADCVKVGVSEVMTEKPDLVISGINAGNNAGINILYSGTIAAAIEARLLGIQAFAISLDCIGSRDFSYCAKLAGKLAPKLLEKPLPEGVVLNVNVPSCEPKGIRFTHQSRAGYTGTLERRSDPKNRDYYWVLGDFEEDDDPDSDLNALRDGYVSITPLRFDRTDHESLQQLESLFEL